MSHVIFYTPVPVFDAWSTSALPPPSLLTLRIVYVDILYADVLSLLLLQFPYWPVGATTAGSICMCCSMVRWGSLVQFSDPSLGCV